MVVLVTIRVSRAFSELDQDPAATEWILFPATPTEKYIAAQLRLGILYYGLALAAALAMSAVMGWIQTMVNGGPFHWLGDLWFGATKTSVTVSDVTVRAPVGGLLWGMICVGASASFGKHAVWKVLLVFIGTALLWFVTMAAVHWIVFADQTQLLMSDRDQAFRTIGFLLSNWQTTALDVLIQQWWFGVLFPAYFILYGWAKLWEVEARHAVQP